MLQAVPLRLHGRRLVCLHGAKWRFLRPDAAWLRVLVVKGMPMCC